MKTSPAFSRAATLCARLGVEFYEGEPPHAAVNCSGAPQHCAHIVWTKWKDKKTIYWNDAKDVVDACGLLHELAHALHPVVPDRSGEYGLFLAVEYELRRLAAIPRWAGEKWQGDSATPGPTGQVGLEWRSLTPAQQQKLLAKSRMMAVRAGRMTSEGRLTALTVKGKTR